jgi:predicted transcriptional regulator
MPDAPDRRLDLLCHALSDATRRSIWQRVGVSPGVTTNELADEHPDLTRWAVMKHLDVLRRAGMIQTLPEGRRRRHYRDERSLQPLRDWLDDEGQASRRGR